MNERQLLVTFDHADDLLSAVETARRERWSIVDVFTPYAVHGLDRAMGLRPSRLTWVCFICGAIGGLGMLWFQHWVAAIAWPINVGGKPWNSLPADVPVAFEMMILLAAFGSVFALLAVSRLYPGKKAVMPSGEITDDRFVMVIRQDNAAFDADAARDLFEQAGAVDVRERVTDEEL
ncbi:MAG: DUF3341 domain-containing protein [Planctomycetota bacterium]|nr:MAG: DUF3341 domain-containing protein [Planctomycetota bacterium]REJ96456.1 MAG: DUF3341 domain-containing protein [Planctomycetota bacterium]REK25100.1 MAG: DUF3341 domain-containing protein [Planctomycetota bacterium]REK44668.1 MAG: DUF3341 domain-containing protein [Planctomycetota bacterium]